MEHEIVYMGLVRGDGFVICQGCGWRSAMMEQHQAEALGDRHWRLAQTGRLNGRRLSSKSLIDLYRTNAQNLTYSREERIQWTLLAEELEAELLAQDKNRQLEGQLEIPFT